MYSFTHSTMTTLRSDKRSCQDLAAAAAEELIRLYVLKGHNAKECERFLRKNHTCADDGHVCVCVKTCA